MTQTHPFATVDIYIAGNSSCRVRVDQIPASDTGDAFSIAAHVLREVAKHIDRPQALRMELIGMHVIHEATIKG